MVDALRAAGASVLEAKVYGWVRPADPGPLLRLCAQVAQGDVHALTFTSAPAVVSFLQTAQDQELLSTVTTMLQHQVMAVAVGPVTAAPLIRADYRWSNRVGPGWAPWCVRLPFSCRPGRRRR